MGRQCAPDAKVTWTPSLRRGKDDWRQLLDAAAALYAEGVAVDWRGFDAPWPRQRVTLSSYPFQRSRYWVDPVQPVVPLSRNQSPEARVDGLPAQVRPMLHEVIWQDAPAGSAGLLDPTSIGQAVEPTLEALAKENGLDAYADFATGLDELASRYIVRAFADLGLVLRKGERFDGDALRKQLGVLDRHGRLFGRMFQILGEDGILESIDGKWRVTRDDASGDSEPLAEALLAQHPDCEAELTLTCRCGRSLASVLRGEDPLPLLFPEGSLADTEKLYQVSPPARTYNSLIASALETALRTWPAGRPLRILEIGAGTGSTTAYVLPTLAKHGAAFDYTFTDVGKVFLQRARDKFANQRGMQYAALDITRDTVSQGYAAGAYDIILAANVLHATPDLAVTVGNVRKLIAPGGMLLLLEGSTTQRFGDLTVGLLDGWWAYTDTNRRDYALMSKAGWRQVLEEQGFSDAVAVPANTNHPVLLQQAVLLARAPVVDVAPARWLIVPDASGVAEALSSKLVARGATVRIASATAALQGWLKDAFRESWDGVIYLAGVDATLNDHKSLADLEAGQERAVGGALVTVQSMAAQTRSTPKLWFVTRGAQATRSGEAADAGQATIWGFSHVVALEHPELNCRRIDLDPATSIQAAAEALVIELTSTGKNEDEVALRAGRRLARRLAPYAPPSVRTLPMKIDPERSYLITGGLRGLGLRVAEWMVEQGARHLALMGRRGADDRAEATLERLRQAGAAVLVITGDVGSAPDMKRAFAEIAAASPPLAGVIHSAGTLDDAVLSKQNWSRFATVFGPKVSGTWLLHTLAPKLDFMVLFSSGASLAGSGGQANHSAANAFEDAIAWYRQAQGLPTVSINWGPWAEIGAAADRKLDKPGSLRAIAPADGLAALAYALRRNADTGLLQTSQIAVLNTDWSHLPDATGERASLFNPAAASSGKSAPVSPPQRPLRERIAATPPARRKIVLRDHIRGQTAKVLGLAKAEDVDIHEPLGQMGLDSLMAVELRNLLGKAAERAFPATLTLDYPSVAALTDHLAQKAFADEIEEARNETGTTNETNFDDMSADELAQQLMERLGDMGEQEPL
jgi:NAD(P)-dependent dehydrogenase (short-subunit alcohol dehydrogenase family)/SAM-dependent methyltransferase/acyl carrier protein